MAVTSVGCSAAIGILLCICVSVFSKVVGLHSASADRPQATYLRTDNVIKLKHVRERFETVSSNYDGRVQVYRMRERFANSWEGKIVDSSVLERVGIMLFCWQRGGHLAHISSKKENTFVQSVCNLLKARYHWIGLTGGKSEGKLRWTDDNGQITFSDWSPAHSSHVYGSNCIVLMPVYNYSWADFVCSIPAYPICEKRAVAKPQPVG